MPRRNPFFGFAEPWEKRIGCLASPPRKSTIRFSNAAIRLGNANVLREFAMRDPSHARRVLVSIWGKPVGTIIATENPRVFAFRYEKGFLTSGLEIAPIAMPIRREPYAFPELPFEEYEGLPPVFADSLPDAFGRGLINRYLSERGFSPQDIGPLDRLAYVGCRGMGALCYEPDRGPSGRTASLEMRRLVESARHAANGTLSELDGADALREIIRLGSSAGGAQAKAVVGWNRRNGKFVFGDRSLPEGFEHWIIKITPKEYPSRGEKEYETYRKAKACGIDMSESRLFDLDGIRHFMTKRFDRVGNERLHVATLSAMAHFPMSAPREFRTYEQYLTTIERLDLGYEAKEQAFRRVAFNVWADECDDHTKNFSFLMEPNGRWRLAPAYDLTGGGFPSGDPWSAHGTTHQLSVNGKFSSIADDDLLAFADRFAIGTAPKVLETMKSILEKS